MIEKQSPNDPKGPNSPNDPNGQKIFAFPSSWVLNLRLNGFKG